MKVKAIQKEELLLLVQTDNQVFETVKTTWVLSFMGANKKNLMKRSHSTPPKF